MALSTPHSQVVVQSEPFGEIGREGIRRWTVSNQRGMTVKILELGGIIQSIEVPDRMGNVANVVLGFASLEEYAAERSVFGCITGRFANRIAGGRFSLDGTAYQLPINSPPSTLHGGHNGFDRHAWTAQHCAHASGAGVTLTRISRDGEEGFPGNVRVSVTYLLTSANALRIDYRAETDAPTVLNLTNHTYFNLAGEGSGDIYGHELTLFASTFLPTDLDAIPLGEAVSVASTPFDFRAPIAIGARIRDRDAQLQRALGYDHTFVLDRPSADDASLRRATRLHDPISGRVLDIATTEPGIQVYSGNFLRGARVGIGGRAYRQGDGIALETQHFPDSPNRPEYPSTALRPGQEFRSTTVWHFGVA